MNDLRINMIIERCKKGDQNAFRELLTQYQNLAYSLAYKILGTKQCAEDAVQDSFVKVWKNLHTFRDKGNLTAWIARIVTNTSLDHQRSIARKSISESPNENEIEELPGDMGNTNAAGQQSDLLRTLQQIVLTLPRRQASIFILRDLQDLRVSEVAQVIGISDGAVKSNLYQARKKIRLKLSAMNNFRDKS